MVVNPKDLPAFKQGCGTFRTRVSLGRQIFACCWRDPNRNARVRRRRGELGNRAGAALGRSAISLANVVSTFND